MVKAMIITKSLTGIALGGGGISSHRKCIVATVLIPK